MRKWVLTVPLFFLGQLGSVWGLGTATLDCPSCKIILLDAGLSASNALDAKIAKTQQQVKAGPNSSAQIERLGWLFVQKARASSDPGYYKLAEQCAICLKSDDSNSMQAMLLQGHVLHSLHRFNEARPIAVQLTERRGLPFDFGLLGDVQYDLGNIPDAAAAYQKMVNLRPDLESYSRVAQLRWITGDLSGAIEAMNLAAGAGSPLNAEPTAWVYARLALWQLQSGDLAAAKKSARTALRMEPLEGQAWQALGRIQLAMGETPEAVQSLEQAVQLTRLPESQWLLADALQNLSNGAEAKRVESDLGQRGASEDPRSFSLYLSTRSQDPALALTLARRELENRQDVFTHDAAAWACQANGRTDEARLEMARALAEGTKDARLFFHAAVINESAGDMAAAHRWAMLARNSQQTLFPSELKRLALLSPEQVAAPHNPSTLRSN